MQTSRTILLSVVCYFIPFLLAAQGFTDVSTVAKVDSVHGNHPFAEVSFGTGACWFDFNLDGYLDIYVSNRLKANCLFQNNGDGTFSEVAQAMGVDDPTGDGAGVAAADFNNDGYPDLYLANAEGDKLFKNINGGSFLDISVSSGITVSGDRRGTSASWGDYDDDGFLDLYICHHEPKIGIATDNQDFLLYNNGDETFTDVSASLGMGNLISAGFIGGFTDFDLDGDRDIVVINDCPIQGVEIGNLLFRNDGGDDPLNWNFTEISDDEGMGFCYNGMGLGVGDSNRDGFLEITYSNIGPALLHENTGGSFIDISTSAGINIQEFNYLTWGTSFFDYNNDGYQDIIMATGDFHGPNEILQPNYLFENNGDDTFTDVAPAMGLDDGNKSRTIVHGDYDNDGDLDVFVVNYDEQMMLKRNDLNNGNHYIKISLQGVTSNRDGVGTYIKIKTMDGMYQYFETRCGSNLGGGDAPGAFFGLGSNTMIDSMIITWPSGIEQVQTNVAADQTLSLVEPDGPLPVEFLTFEAIAQASGVLLKWSTASENENELFSIQRSGDGRTFESIGSIAGQGSSTQTTAYTFTDPDPFTGGNYYRLMQVDSTGQNSYSPVRWLWFEAEKPDIRIFPNPLEQEFLTVRSTEMDRAYTVEITNIHGLVVYRDTFEGETRISTGDWPEGIYLVKANTENEGKVFKLVKH